jgi:hypothetical protein
LTGCCPTGNPKQILANPDKSGLEGALDLSKNVLDQAKRDFGNSLLKYRFNNFSKLYILSRLLLYPAIRLS